MSSAARFPDHGRSPYPALAGCSWAGGEEPTPDPAHGMGCHSHPGGEVPYTGYFSSWDRAPGAHSTPWAGGAPDHGWRPNTSAKPTHLPNQWANWSGGFEYINRFYQPGEHYGYEIDHQQKRLRWRDEILRGDPEKAINDSLPDASRLVITFISRGSPEHPHGQGLELLRFKAPSRRPSLHYSATDSRAGWAHFAMDAGPLFKIKEDDVVLSAAELSTKVFAYLLPHLDVKKDLKLVRKSKPLLWDNTTVLESFLYRIVEEKEHPESEAAMDLAARLGGPTFHGWYPIMDVLGLKMSDLICTALTAVCFPPPLSLAIDNILADQESRPDQLSLKALDVFYFCIQHKFALTAFKFYPIPPPPPDHPEFIMCIKRRVWAYWTEVLAWHLSQLREDTQVSISYSVLKPLSAIKDAVDDPKVATLEQLDCIMVAALATEADRSRHATNTLIQEAIWECLHNQSFAPPEKLLGKMHIITAGSSSIVYSVITKLITEVLSRKISSIENSLQSSVNRKIIDLKITIAESRPLSEGVILAAKLIGVVESYMEYRDRASKQAGINSATSTSGHENPLFDPEIQSRLNRGMSEKDKTRMQPPKLGLFDLLKDIDAKKEKKEPKVTIEVITDAAVVSTTMASGSSGVKPIILLSADRILPNGDSVNKVGSAQESEMADAGKSSGGVVLILCRADRIHSKDLPVPPKPKNPADELVMGWESTVSETVIQELQGSSHVELNNPIYEDIGHKHITGYITELGLMQNNLVTEFSNMRTDILEKTVWPVNALTAT